MFGIDSERAAYIAEINQWQQTMDDRLRKEDGWLTLIGLHWLHEGINTIGSNPTSDIPLPADKAPAYLGTITLTDGQATLQVAADVAVMVDGNRTSTALLRDDTAVGGPSQVSISSLTFFVIQRGDDYAVRVRDANNPARLAFTGRKWFPIDPQYRVNAIFVPYPAPHTLQIVNFVGQTVPMNSPGQVEFVLHGQRLSLEAFSAADNQLWFVFKDVTSGSSTYGAGRFLYAPLSADNTVSLDFNKAYHPPCAFTPYATCPLPPKGNVLPVPIRAGEHL